jgi:hypothetical protein
MTRMRTSGVGRWLGTVVLLLVLIEAVMQLAMDAIRPRHLAVIGCVGLTCVVVVALVVFPAARLSRRP